MRAPDFWAGKGSGQRAGRGAAILDPVLPHLLAPAGFAYAAAARLRTALVRPGRAPLPVICVGNLVAGGAGKTPAAISLGEPLRRAGMTPHFLSRGYGGVLGASSSAPVRVDPARHGAREVGDEALLLSAAAPTWVSRDRLAAAKAAAAAGADVAVMDDGFQNPTIAKDLSLVVVDGGYGFGNGKVMPAGPLREGIGRGLARADAVALVGEDDAGAEAVIAGRVQILKARLVPDPGSGDLRARKVVAFAGIARPEKFFRSLEAFGCEIVSRRGFPDHHPYTERDIADIAGEAERSGAAAVTTAKDAVRLPEGTRERVRVFSVHLEWDDPEALTALLARVTGHG